MRDYSEIPGWFNEEWLYDRMIGHVRDGATFVEVGCWLGKSTAYCARRILESGKAIRFVAVDTWEGSPSEPDMTEAVAARAGGSVFPLFCANMEELGVSGSIHIMKMPSVAAAGLFENGSLDFVFIDADHSREALQADITAWRPKIRIRWGRRPAMIGTPIRTVQEAVLAVFLRLGDFRVEGNCWIPPALILSSSRSVTRPESARRVLEAWAMARGSVDGAVGLDTQRSSAVPGALRKLGSVLRHRTDDPGVSCFIIAASHRNDRFAGRTAVSRRLRRRREVGLVRPSDGLPPIERREASLTSSRTSSGRPLIGWSSPWVAKTPSPGASRGRPLLG